MIKIISLLMIVLISFSCVSTTTSIFTKAKIIKPSKSTLQVKKKEFPILGHTTYGEYKVWCLVNKKYERLLRSRIEYEKASIAYTIILYNKEYYVVTSDIHPKDISLKNSINLLEQYRGKEVGNIGLICEDELVRVYGLM